MNIFGLGKSETHKFKFNKGEKVIYVGSVKKYQGEQMTVVAREHDKKQGNLYDVRFKGKIHTFTENVLLTEMVLLSEGLGDVEGLGKAPKYTIQQVDEIAKKIQHNSGVKKTVKHYNISRKEAKEMAFEKVKTISPKVILKSIK